MTVLPKLTVQNKHRRMTFAEWAQNNEISFNNIWFSKGAHFHSVGVVNKQNMRLWLSEKPRVIHEKSSHGLIWPISFEETVKSGRHLSILPNTFMRPLLATGLSLQTQWFMQDGARSHIHNIGSIGF
jgi:hypothetical protein